jgi:saccharopine dehydrogenase-like NADP-dependent oxidoreductase
MPSNTYKNVLLVGASGNVGKNILLELLADSNFKISILSRIDSSASFSSDINVIKVDYSDKPALVKALIGQDIVISAVGGEAIINNFDKILIEAALEASIKWFIPSEYGFDLDNSSVASIPVLHSPIREH